MCSACGEPRPVRAVELTGPEPVGPLADEELIELQAEREELREQIRVEELTRPYVWPSLMERHDALAFVDEPCRLQSVLADLERRRRRRRWGRRPSRRAGDAGATARAAVAAVRARGLLAEAF